MGILIVRLLAALNSEKIDSTYYHIAFTLLKHYEQISSKSIGEIANLCNVSKSTISKFARQLGFDDYLDLKEASHFVENRFNNKKNFNDNVLGFINDNGLEGYKTALKNDIDELLEKIYSPQIIRIARDLKAYKVVGAFGLLFSELSANDLQYKLAYNNKYIVTFQDDKKQEAFIQEADEETLIIIYSNSGTFIEKQQIRLGQPKKNYFDKLKAKIVMITSNPEAINHPNVDYIILIPHTTSMQTHGIINQVLNDLIAFEYRKINMV